ncbi:MAG: glycosyltransferase family 39 protein, partial [Microgenomates group bacterium]
MKLFKKIFFNQYFFIVFVFFLTFFLRFFDLPRFISYHQDQVRDLLYVKKHFDNHQIILLGPKASVGNFYLPPFWYYLMTIAYFFSPSPLAPAFMVVILNSLTVVFIYIFAKKFFDQKTAIFSSLLYAVSPISIEYSRFAWNPNLIPFFTILTLYFLFLYLFEKNNLLYFVLGVIFANLSLQLHYQGFIIFSFYFLAILLFKKLDLKKLFLYIFLNLILVLPFLIYEFRY